MAATRSVTADSPRRHKIFINLSSASVSVFDFFGGISILLISHQPPQNGAGR
jgi:hypothetical protein